MIYCTKVNFYMRKIFINLVLFFSSIAVVVIIINILLLIYSDYFLKQKFISQKYIRLFPVQSAFLYHDTYKSLENYNLIIGDSHSFGNGDSYLNLDYNYSIGHYLHNLSEKKNNFINIGIPGAGSELAYLYAEKFILKVKDYPKSIQFIFYEGNDLTDNIRYKKLKNDKKQKIAIFIGNYFPIYHFSKNYYFFLLADKKKIKKIKKIQAPPMELTNEDLELSIEIFFDTILKLKKFSENISIVYIPSPATVVSNHPIQITSYLNNMTLTFSRSEIEKRSILIRNIIEKFAIENNFLFLDTTKKLKKISVEKNIYGPKDILHPNKIGYEVISKLIFFNLN